MPEFEKKRIVVIETDSERRDRLRSALNTLGYVPFFFDNEIIYGDNLDNLKADLIIVGGLPMIRIIRFLNGLKKKERPLPVLILSSDRHVLDFIKENINFDIRMICETQQLSALDSVIKKMLDHKFTAIPTVENYGLVGTSKAVGKVKKMIRELRDLPDTVLIHGEAGTGKEKIARAIHYYSKRKDKPFVKLNSTLFSKSFSNPDALNKTFENKRKNLNITWDIFKSASRGTLFIQEIGDIPNRLQADMLFFVDESEKNEQCNHMRENFDVRIIASTTRRLEDIMTLGKFRKDLYFRLNVFNMKVPPLRNRREDILPLADFFSAEYCKELNKSMTYMPPQIRKFFYAYHWPGNVRELENLIKRFVLSGNDAVFREYFKLVETTLHKKAPLQRMQSFANTCTLTQTPDLKKYLEDNKHHSLKRITADFVEVIEKEFMQKALEITNWNRRQAAVILDISYKSLLNKIKTYKLALN
jgi:DNA-binding NtrC family response regulator